MSDLLATAPRFSEAQAGELLRTHYGVAGKLSALESERDQNFKVVAEAGRYIFKIINAAEPEMESDFQTALLAHVSEHAPDLPIPRLMPTLAGGALGRAVVAGGLEHRLRLVLWLNGVPLAKTRRSEAALSDLGSLLGRFDKALRGFMHPGAVRDLDWDLRRAGEARKRLDAIAGTAERVLVEHFLERFEEGVEPRLAGLRGAVIHNDANDWNVLVDPDDPNRLCGLIDFGDALHTALISEVAIAAAYAGMELDDPIGAVAAVAAGFHREYPLLEEEVDLLYDLIAMRLVTSVTLSASRRALVEHNPYLAISEKPAWNLLLRLRAMDPLLVKAIVRHRLGFEAAPGARAVAGWIGRNRRSLAPVLARPVASYPAERVPLGDGEHPIARASGEGEAERAQALWQEQCAEHGTELGVGPWGEARSVYTSAFFESRFIRGARRTRHLGLDLFRPAGTRLYTPLPGRVKCVAVEDARLGYGCLVALEHRPKDCPPFLTLWGHLAHEAMDRLETGQELEAGALVGEMGPPEENGGWAPHVHLQICADPDFDACDIPGVGEERYLDVWAELFPDAAQLAGLAPEFFGSEGRPPEEIVALRKKLLLPNLSISYDKPIKFVRGEGVWLVDDHGRAYLDCFNNVCHVGHAHPAVVEALSRQAALLNTNTRYLHDNIVAYAERLTATMPKELCVAAFVNSGSEANSLALRMMRAHTGREHAIVLDWAYHGTTQELIDLSPYKFQRSGGKGASPHVHVAVLPDAYRAPRDWPGNEYGKRFAESVAAQIAALGARGEAPGFFLAESIPSVAGQIFLPEGYLDAVYRLVREAGGICIADEVQVGLGRVGSHWWAFETQGVVPDIVTAGKPIGNGHPLGAVIARREVADSFANGMEYFNTFGGNPVSCAVGLAVLDAIERDGLRDNAARIGDYLLAGFGEIKKRHAVIGDIRGRGLFLGIELVRDRGSKEPATDIARKVCDRARQLGVLMGTEGPHDNVLKMRPPMIFSKADADLLLDVLEESFTAAAV